MANAFPCIHKDRCRSPLACSGFGYCRERNFDGHGMHEAEVARRKQESDNDSLKAGRAC